MARAYFTLLSREPEAGSPWAIEFGDYERETVAEEMSSYRDHGHKARDLKIIRTTDRQSAIDAAVRKLNQPKG